MSADPAILLDVSRLISRLGTGPATGIDRVEAEWLQHLVRRGAPFLLLARVRRGQLLLPAQAGTAILEWLAGICDDLPQPALIDRMRGRQDARTRAEAALRGLALFSAGPTGRDIAAEAIRVLGTNAVYLNAGHSNLKPRLLEKLSPLRRAVVLHDTIPLDHPEFTRSGQSEKFQKRFAAAVGGADLLLAISQATRESIIEWRDRLRLPQTAQIAVAPIGTRLARPGPLPPGLDQTRPIFVVLGTIEPRKNHALLLDAWQLLAERLPAGDMPQLAVIGRRGWENHATFARLDQCGRGGPVTEFSDLDDDAVAGVIAACRALLMPSRAEGFGLPYTEAAARGVPVICAPLPVARELLGDYAHYLSPEDPGVWAELIARFAAAPAARQQPLSVPQWDGHFATVEGLFNEGLHRRSATAMPR